METKMDDYTYLNNERLKLWEKLTELESETNRLEKLFVSNLSDEEKSLRETLTNAKATLDDSKETLTALSETLKSADANLDESIKIQSFLNKAAEIAKNDADEISKNQTISSDNTTEISKLYRSTYELHEKIMSIYEELEELEEKKQQAEKNTTEIDEIYSEAKDALSKIDSTLKNSASRKNDIDKLYYKIFGYAQKDPDTNEESIVKGLKDELEESYKQLKINLQETEQSIENLRSTSSSEISAYQSQKEAEIQTNIEKWNIDIEAIKTKINRLLPEALTTGLSYAYSDKKKEEKSELKSHRISFGLAIILMMIVSSVPIAVSFYQIIKENMGLDAAILQLPRLVLAIIPLYIPALWIAYASNKKINLSKRLIEEYSHKEALSKTYEGLSTQIENLEDSEVATDLRTKLLYNILEVSSENPGKLISDYNKSDHPIMDALDRSVKLTDSLSKIARIPGFKTMAKKLADNAEKALQLQSEKADIALESVNSKKAISSDKEPTQ